MFIILFLDFPRLQNVKVCQFRLYFGFVGNLNPLLTSYYTVIRELGAKYHKR